MEVIEHVDNPEELLERLAHCLKPSGLLMLSTIARNPWTWLTHILIAEKIAGIIPKGTHHHEKFINSSELKKMMEAVSVDEVGKLELEMKLQGELEETKGGSNYLLMGKKRISNVS